MPYCTISVSSRACVPCGNGPTSEPTANGTPAAICFLNSLILYSQHFGFGSSLILRLAMVREIVEDGEGRHGEDALLLHQANGLVAQLRGVID